MSKPDSKVTSAVLQPLRDQLPGVLSNASHTGISGNGGIGQAETPGDFLNQLTKEEKAVWLDLIVLLMFVAKNGELRYLTDDQLAVLLQVKIQPLRSLVKKAQDWRKIRVLEKAIVPVSHRTAAHEGPVQISVSHEPEVSIPWVKYMSMTLLDQSALDPTPQGKSDPLRLLNFVGEIEELIQMRINTCERKWTRKKALLRTICQSPVLDTPIKGLPKDVTYYDPAKGRPLAEELAVLGKGISLWDEDPIHLRDFLMAQRFQGLIEFKALYFTLLGKPETRKAMAELVR